MFIHETLMSRMNKKKVALFGMKISGELILFTHRRIYYKEKYKTCMLRVFFVEIG